MLFATKINHVLKVFILVLDTTRTTTTSTKKECKTPINLTFRGVKGTQCKWFHYVPGQEKPCCYAESRFGESNDVCPRRSHLAAADQENCRGGSRSKAPKPKVEMDGDRCTLSIEDPNAQDVGRYDGFMPHNSKSPHRENVGFDQICN